MMSSFLEAAVRSLLVALAVWAGMRVFRVQNVLAQKAAWGLVLVAALFMPVVSPWVARVVVMPASVTLRLPPHPFQLLRSMWTKPEAMPVPTPVVREERFVPSSGAPVHAVEFPSHGGTVATPPVGVPASVISHGYISSAATLVPQPVEPVRMLPLRVWALSLYLAVTGALIVRLLYGLASAVLLWLEAMPVREGMVSDLRVRASAAVASPVTIGSAVVLPEDYATWDSEKLRIVLAHERSHVRQGDFYLQILAGLYSACTWFSPLGWWIKGKLSELAEAISDRAGLEQAVSPASYAQVLLEFAAAPRPTSLGVAMACQGSLSRRIDRLLNDKNFKQGFAGGRRALAAVMMVPLALFATTALIRVQAAGQAPAQPATEPQPAAEATTPAVPSTPATTAAPAPAAAVADAPEADDEQDVPPPPPAAQVLAPAPPAPKAPLAPPARVMVMTAPSPMAIVAPLPPMPPMHIVIRTDAVHAFAIAQAEANGAVRRHGYSYHYSNNGESYAVIAGDGSEHMTFSGDIHTSEIDKARQKVHGDFLWFDHEGKSYVVDDPAVLAQIKSMYAPMEALGKQQEDLGRRQEELGKQQEEMGRRQEQVSVPTPDMRKEMAELNEAMAKLQAKMGKTVTQEELADFQGKLGDLQGRLGEIQGEMGSRQGQFGAEQGKLGAMQGKLGAEQGKLGAEQGRLAEEADKKVKSIIDESLKNGKARPVD